MVKSKYFKTGNGFVDNVCGHHVFRNNFYKKELHVYLKAVVEFNRRCGMEVLYIYENAYDINGNLLKDYYAIMYSNEFYTSDLSYFWRIFDLYKYRYIENDIDVMKECEVIYSKNDEDWHRKYLKENYIKAKEFFKKYKNNYYICIRDMTTYNTIKNIKIKKRS